MRIASLFLVMVVGVGCTQLQMLPYLDQLLLLKSFGEEKDAQHKYVVSIDQKFDKLLAAVQSGEIAQCHSEHDVTAKFGPPILAQTMVVDGKVLKRSLYRYVMQNKSPQKVYLYYDSNGRLIKWENPS